MAYGSTLVGFWVSFAYVLFWRGKLRPTVWTCRLQSCFGLIYRSLVSGFVPHITHRGRSYSQVITGLALSLTDVYIIHTPHTHAHAFLHGHPQDQSLSALTCTCNYCTLIIRMYMCYNQETKDRMRERESAPSPMDIHIHSRGIPHKYCPMNE